LKPLHRNDYRGILGCIFEVNTSPLLILFINTLTQSGRQRLEKHNKTNTCSKKGLTKT